MKKSVLSFATITTFLVVGCTLFPYTHKPPEKIIIDNEKFINKPQEKVWSTIFSVFFQDTFKLESSDKAAGTIIATFKTDRANNYVDCGVVKRKYRDKEKVVHEYTYNYADSTKYNYEKEGQIYEAEVKTDLITEITTNVAKVGEGTKVTINTHYTLNREVLSTNPLDGSKLPPEKEKIEFTTSEPYKTAEFSCVANGSIENNILHSIN